MQTVWESDIASRINVPTPAMMLTHVESVETVKQGDVCNLVASTTDNAPDFKRVMTSASVKRSVDAIRTKIAWATDTVEIASATTCAMPIRTPVKRENSVMLKAVANWRVRAADATPVMTVRTRYSPCVKAAIA